MPCLEGALSQKAESFLQLGLSKQNLFGSSYHILYMMHIAAYAYIFRQCSLLNCSAILYSVLLHEVLIPYTLMVCSYSPCSRLKAPAEHSFDSQLGHLRSAAATRACAKQCRKRAAMILQLHPSEFAFRNRYCTDRGLSTCNF